jgi:beta-N-acetylglucosaminidase
MEEDMQMKFEKKIIISFFVIIILSIILNICFNINTSDATESTKIYDYTLLDDSKYPGIKSELQKLKDQYDNSEKNVSLNFQIYETGINWEDALVMEFQGHNNSPKNLIEKTSTRAGMWFCPICTTKKYDSGYNCASLEALAYMMDPRNSLTIDSIFQFKTLAVSDVTESDIAKVVSGTFLNTESIIKALVQASQEASVNGYYITSKIINEQGKGGSTLSLGKGYNGNYVGYYNLFNIGAYGNGDSAILNNGLKYAKDADWDTPEKSILGGVSTLKSYYIDRQQDTLYFQKFNVVSESKNIFNHQYQQNIMAAEMEGRTIKSYYMVNGELTGTHTFVIPVYENMPNKAASRPSATKENTTEYEVAEVTVGSKDVLSVFSSTSSSKICITSLNNGETVKVLKRATTAIDGIYYDLIVSESKGYYGYVARNSSSGDTYLKLTGEAGTTGNNTISIANLIFDSEYYANKYPDLKATFGNDKSALKTHWLEFGIQEGRQASPIFNAVYYLENNADLKKAFGNDYMQAYEHFIQYGYKELRASSSEYCGADYKNNYDDLKNMTAIQLIQHYLNYGIKENRIARGQKITLTSIETLLYDESYYLSNNPDVKKAYTNASSNDILSHWINYGIKEGRKASRIFDANYYLYNNEDLLKAFGMNYESAYKHFINYGYKELRASSAEYYGSCYKNNNSDLKNMSALQLIQHYLKYGVNEKRIANNKIDLTPIDITNYLFDKDIYIYFNKDVYEAFGDNEIALRNHWLQYGIKEGRIASLLFDADYYINNYADLKKAFGTDKVAAYNHFISNGAKEGRKASKYFDVKYYLDNNSDLKSTFSSSYTLAIKHFSEFGINETRDASGTFKLNTYMKNADLLTAFAKNYKQYYIHYIEFGYKENRIAY